MFVIPVPQLSDLLWICFLIFPWHPEVYLCCLLSVIFCKLFCQRIIALHQLSFFSLRSFLMRICTCTYKSVVAVKSHLNTGWQRNKICPLKLSRPKSEHTVTYSLQRSTLNFFCPLRHHYHLESPFYLPHAKLVLLLCFHKFNLLKVGYRVGIYK